MSLNDFLLDATPTVAMVECIEIGHSLWPAPLRYVLNSGLPIDVLHGDGTPATYEYMPLQLKRGTATNDLEQTLKITVPDLGQVVPQLLKIIRDAETEERPYVVYRTYSTANYNTPLIEIDGLWVEDKSSNSEAVTFTAASSRTNVNGTGMIYSVDEFPSLRAFF